MREISDLTALVRKEEMQETIEWLTVQTPYRLAGSSCAAKAAEYVAQRMQGYGLEVRIDEFYAYNSAPIRSKVRITAPIQAEIDSLPCAHIRSTGEEGQELELVYVGSGRYEDYQGQDVKGKMVLVEVSYAPPVPEKARIAWEMGAAGIMCMNWGNDEEVICNRGLKGVWGNPTEETFEKIPDLIGVGITRRAGLKLKELCQSGQAVRIHVTAIATREWSLLQQPVGILRGNGRKKEFLLVCSHLDAWQPGVTCNATGNATALEICRILAMNREKLDRDIWFVFWSGHEIAEAAGSTWFLDHYWNILNQSCALYMHIDSTGVRQTKLFEIKASEELLQYAADNYTQESGVHELRTMPLKKIGDQSFMGIGIPSITQRMSFTTEDIERAHGATLGWWNHTKEDSLDKCDLDILETDTKVTLAILAKMACEETLPYRFEPRFQQVRQSVEALARQYRGHMYWDDLLEKLRRAQEAMAQIQARQDQYHGDHADTYNRFVMAVCRSLTNVVNTYADKYQQDSYGHSRLSNPIPLFADLARLEQEEPDSMAYGILLTQLVKNKNRILDALQQVEELAGFAKQILL